MFICSYVFIHSLQVKFFIFIYLVLCIDSFIVGLLSWCLFVHMYWFIHFEKSFCLYDYLLWCIDSYIAGKTMGNSDVKRKAAETRSSTLLQTIQNFPWKPGGCGTSQIRVIAEPTNPCGICHSGPENVNV